MNDRCDHPVPVASAVLRYGRRAGFRLKLRRAATVLALLLLALVLCTVAGVAWLYNGWTREERMIASIWAKEDAFSPGAAIRTRAIGPDFIRAHVPLRYQYLFHRIVEVRVCTAVISLELIDSLSDASHLEVLHLSRGSVRDEDLVPLPRLRRLKRLNLNGADITDAMLESIARLPSLQELDISGTRVTPAGLGSVRHVPKVTAQDLRPPAQ